MKKVIISIVIVLLAAVAVCLALLRQTEFSYSGVIEAVEVDVPSRLDDVITRLNIDDGSTVSRGDILAVLECKPTDLQYNIAKKEYERAQSLLKTAAGSQENYDLKKHQYDMAALSRTWCNIASPIDGRVLYKYYEAGDFIGAGRKLATVSDLSRVNVWVYVEHDMLHRLNPGQKIRGYLPEAGRHFEGTILTINDEAEFTPKNVQTRAERTRLVFGVKTRFDNDKSLTLKPGMTLEITF